MGGHARQSTVEVAPTPAAPAPTTAGQRRGNAAAGESLGTTPGEQLPAGVSLQSAGVTFALPANATLTGGWNPLVTQGRTQVWLSVDQAGLHVRFSPELLVDAVWPLSNCAWSGVDFDFATAQTSAVHLRSTQFGLPVSSTVESEVRSFLSLLVAGTPLGEAGYDPLQDQDLGGTLAGVQRNFQSSASSGSSGEGLSGDQIDGLGASASFATSEEIAAGVEAGGVRLPAGTTVDVSAGLAGTLAQVGGNPEVQYVDVASSGFLLEHKGEAVARLTRLRIHRGGRVDVVSFEALGSLAEAGGVESAVRLLGLFAALAGSGATERDLGNIRGDILDPGVVNGVAERKIEEALTGAVVQLVETHAQALPGVDLRRVLGVGTPTQG